MIYAIVILIVVVGLQSDGPVNTIKFMSNGASLANYTFPAQALVL